MSAGNSGDRFRELEQAYGEYTVYDQHYEKIGKVDDIFVDENDEPEYIGVKTGLLGMKSTLIPIELVRVNDRRKLVEVAADEETIKHAPTFDNDNDITPDYEDRVHGYFGLERPPARQGSGGYGSYSDSSAEASREEELRRSVDTEYGERTGAPERPAATYSGGSTDTNLDIPLEDTGRAEPEASPPQQEVTGTAGDPYAAAAARHQEGSRRDENEVQGDRSVRVFKRTRAVRE